MRTIKVSDGHEIEAALELVRALSGALAPHQLAELRALAATAPGFARAERSALSQCPMGAVPVAAILYVIRCMYFDTR